MITITPNLNPDSKTPLYMQLYAYIRDAILTGFIPTDERLPSLRRLAKELSLSLTTIEMAYEQLEMEGYVESKPQSGFFVNHIPSIKPSVIIPEPLEPQINSQSKINDLYFDPACFDFTKWKKCINRILTDYSHLLFEEGELRGEAALRHEISKYLYQARGVRCTPEQIVTGAGTHQLISLLSIILNRMGIDHAAFEEPGYLPVRNIFLDRNFKISSVPLDRDGICIEKLPLNIRSTVYVSPSNQFPTGSVMPAARRYALLHWASENKSVIIEDDYNSELRYAGRPVPSLQGLDDGEQVVYLGSFSSTLFPAVKISYMVLPAPMLRLFEEALKDYTQTCSKVEQLTLALYMQQGHYQTNIRKLRKLYTQKIQIASDLLVSQLGGSVDILSNTSGLHMLLEFPAIHGGAKTGGGALPSLCNDALREGILLVPVSHYPMAAFYYNRIPLEQMEEAILKLKAITFKYKTPFQNAP